jgi:hypothetical protein
VASTPFAWKVPKRQLVANRNWMDDKFEFLKLDNIPYQTWLCNQALPWLGR